jgi:photosystem II stability/assembly factor-like uncharacterized protein
MTIRLLSLLAAALSLSAEHRLVTCIVTTRNWVVGTRMLPSGVFARDASGHWQHLGYSHPYVAGVAYDGRDPSALYLAAGNGLIRARGPGMDWTILTSHDVTELRDVSVDPNAPGTLYFAHTAGIRVTRDGGRAWRELAAGMRERYTETVRADRSRAGRVVAGGVDGLWTSGDFGASWKRAGAPGVSIMRVEQSPHDPCRWIAVTERAGVFSSSDCGATFENAGDFGVTRNLYDVAYDPATPGRVAAAGWGTGVAVSADGGRKWEPRGRGLPGADVWSVAWDPDRPGRLFAAVHEEAVYVSDDAGLTWRKDGLDGSIVYRMRFVPEVRP